MKTTILAIPAMLLIVSAAWASPLVSSVGFVNPPQVVAAKQASGFAFLRTHRQGKGITATWSMASYDGIAGFTIQRTYEDPTDPYAYWEDLSILPCDVSRSFSYTDKGVFPGFITYRIVAHMMDGSSAVSETSSIRIVSRR